MQRVQITTLQRGRLCVYCQDVSVNQRLVISRIDSRHWELARALWTGGKWVTQELIDTYPAQAVALVQAGAWFERLALATAPPADGAGLHRLRVGRPVQRGRPGSPMWRPGRGG